jgi:hypothetical protein
VSLRLDSAALAKAPLLFLVFGPLIGYVGTIVPLVLFDSSNWRTGDWGNEFLTALQLSPAAYLFGGMPALLTGFIYAALLLYLPEWVRGTARKVVASGLIGILCSALVSLLLGLSTSGFRSFLLAGALGGVGCALLIRFREVDFRGRASVA